MAIPFGDVLQKLGFSEEEATLYVVNTELGEAPASVIAKKAGMNRSTTYVYLKAMEQKGLVGSTDVNGTQVFYAKDPETVLKHAEQSVGELRKALPDFRALNGRAGAKQPRVQYFPGIEGIKTVLEDTLTAKETVLTFGDADMIVANLAEYYDDYIQRRVAAGIRTRAVLNAGSVGRRFLETSHDELRDVRLVAETFAMPNEIKIYDGKVAIMSHKAPYGGVLIHDQAIYETQKSIFAMAWEFAGAA